MLGGFVVVFAIILEIRFLICGFKPRKIQLRLEGEITTLKKETI